MSLYDILRGIGGGKGIAQMNPGIYTFTEPPRLSRLEEKKKREKELEFSNLSRMMNMENTFDKDESFSGMEQEWQLGSLARPRR